MYSLNLKLRQHTPMIHFQYDQENATLRASELKPKLDKFIIQQVGKENIHDTWKGKWDEKSGITPLNYQVKIVANPDEDDQEVRGQITNEYVDRRGIVKKESFPTFFAHMESRENQELTFQDQFQFTKHFLVNLTFQFPSKELRDKINKALPEFFMRHNFGTRQSKGFGCFLPDDEKAYKRFTLPYWFDVDVNEKYLPKMTANYVNSQSITVPFRQYFELFRRINLFYSSLRSGINQNWGAAPMYFKSMMFMYAKDKLSVQWDKKTIKENFYRINLERQKSKSPGSDILNFSSPKKYLLRDLLGLASRSDWKAEYDDVIVKNAIGKSAEIKRFQSPILFKPVELGEGLFRVYFDANQSAVDSFSNQEFEIRNKSSRSFTLHTPAKGFFDIHDFIRYAVSINLENHIQLKGSGYSNEKQILNSIYTQIRRNLKS